MLILYPPDTPDRQREARDKIEQMAAAYRASFAGQDYVRRRAAAIQRRDQHKSRKPRNHNGNLIFFAQSAGQLALALCEEDDWPQKSILSKPNSVI